MQEQGLKQLYGQSTGLLKPPLPLQPPQQQQEVPSPAEDRLPNLNRQPLLRRQGEVLHLVKDQSQEELRHVKQRSPNQRLHKVLYPVEW